MYVYISGQHPIYDTWFIQNNYQVNSIKISIAFIMCENKRSLFWTKWNCLRDSPIRALSHNRSANFKNVVCAGADHMRSRYCFTSLILIFVFSVRDRNCIYIRDESVTYLNIFTLCRKNKIKTFLHYLHCSVYWPCRHCHIHNV